uniref:BACK domain-containing protein n=1 Tax=Romanomermis culicivorax TaxID=13658 RepID=A0A915KP53_ROMCU
MEIIKKTSHWMEASINQAKFKVNADFRVAKILLQYIYQDRIDEISQCKPDEDEQDFLNLLCKLLAAADEWLLDGLKRLCEKELCKLVSLKNCLELLQLAKTYNAENLHKCCRIFACLNICSLITSSQFINLDAHLVTKLEETYKNGGFNVVCSPVKTFDNRAVVEAVETAFVTLKSCDIDDEDLDALCRQYAKRTTNIVAVVDQSDLNKSLKKANAEIVSKTQSPVSSSKYYTSTWT